MCRYKANKLKKGYVLIYTLLIALLIMTLLIYSFTLELKITKNIKDYKLEVSNSKKYEEYREYLLTGLKQIITANIHEVTKTNIKAYFIANRMVLRVDENKGTLRYNKDEDYFYVESYEDRYSYKREVFSYDVINNNLRFMHIRDEYIEGVIE